MASLIFPSLKVNAAVRSRLRLWAFAIALGFSNALAIAAAPIVQTFFVPFPETDFQTSLKAIDTTGTPVGNSLKTIISLVVPNAGTVITYDHWEDGYEPNPSSPGQSTTQVWGDGNLSNGTAPGYPSDILPAGAVITLNNNIAMPRAATTIAYDGRDRVSVTKPIAMTRAGWAIAPGTVLASASEIYDTRKWGTSFKIPVGSNTASQQQFEYSSLHIIASQNGTVVTVDKDGNGSTDQTQTLNLGDSMFVNGSIMAGALVTATHPVEVHELTGDIGSSYESRTFAIRPTALWSSNYYAPVGTTLASEVHNIYLYNPGASAITMNYETTTGTGTFSVPANGNYEFHMPMNSGAHFFSNGSAPFYAVGANDAGGAANVNQTHDWGYALLPDTALTTSIVTAWAPGSDDLASPIGVPDQNGSPVWVTPTRNTIVYVNYSGNLAVGANTAPDDNKYDVSYTVSKLQSQTIYNATTKDMTKARIFTADGTTLAAAWGEDPSKASAGAPCLDMGTTIIPFPLPVFTKSAALVVDGNSDGKIGTGDTVEYSLFLNNDGVVDLPNALIEDNIPSGTTYVAGSTKIDNVSYADDTLPDTIFPLDNGGLSLPAVPAGNSVTVKFRITVNPGATNVANTAYASSDGVPLPMIATVGFSVLTGPGSTPCTVTFANSGGTAVTSYASGASLYVKVTDGDANTSPTTAETMTAVITDATTGDQELVTLTETGINTGVFLSAALPSSTTTGIGQQDGTLYAQPGQTLTVTHTDANYGDVCTNTAVVTVPSQTKYLYLSDPAQALDRVDPVAANDLTTANTATMGLGSSTITTVGAAATANSTQTATTHSFNYDSGSTGSNRVLMVGVSYRNNNSQTATVKYAGQTMTAVGSDQVAAGTPDGRIYIFSLVNPPTGSNSLAVTWSAALVQGSVIGAITYAGVDQTTPTGTFVSANNGSVASTTPSVTVASATGKVVFGLAEGRSTSAYTVGGTSLWSSIPYPGQTAGAGQSAAGAASVTLNWTGSNAVWVAGGVSLNPAAGGGVTTATFTQAPVFTSSFVLPAATAPAAVAYFTTSSGSMPLSPSITAVLKHNGTTFATSSGTTSDGTKLTFAFPAFVSPVTIASGEVISMVVTTAQSGVNFTLDYDSTTKPSKISLPTNTVIQIPSYGLYSAPYPGGSLITSIGNGQTVYARASVTDPFGTYDISSTNVLISNSGGTVLSVSAPTVSDNGTTKIYEYAWTSGPTDDAYTIRVTANEGTEGINATSTLPIQVTSTDLGTPSTTTFTDASGTKVSSYTTTGPVYVQVIDRDQNTNSAVAETVTAVVTTANGDRETITLTETGINTGIFRSGPITTNTSSVTQGNNALNVVAGTGLHVAYVDPNDPSDTSNDDATIAAPPAVATVSAFKTLVSPADGTALVGDTVTYNIQVTNPGTVTLPTVSLTDTFPAAKLQYVSATVAPSTVVSGTLSWTNIGPLTAGQSVSIQVSFTALAAGATVTNSASVGGTASYGPTTANVAIDNPKVTVTKTVLTPASGPAYVGDNMTYRIVVQNSGSTALTTVPLQDAFPGASLKFVSATVAPSSSGYGSLLWNNIGPIAVSNSVTIDVTFKVLAASTLADNLAIVNGAVDGPGNPVPTSQSTVSLQLVAFNSSGKVSNDANGLKDSTVNGTGTNVAGTLYANLLDNVNNVVATVAVAADGSYSFSGLAHNTTYSVQISTDQGTVGDFAPTTLLPANWVATGEHIGLTAGDDGSPDGILDVVIGSADVTNANFGIDRAPTVSNVTPASQVNPGGITRVTVPAFNGTDPEDPSLTTFVILTLPTNGTLYYNGTAVTTGQRITSYNPSLLTLDPDNGSITVSFTYLAEDAAGVASAPASVSMAFTALSISGNVLNDTNALTDNTINGSGTDAGGNLYVLLISSGLIIDNATVAPDGSYSFGTVAPNTTYSVVLSTAPGVLGGAAPSATLPSGWRSTGEHLGAGAGSDGSVNGKLSVPVVTSNVTNANLGIEQVGTLTGHLYIDTNGNGTQEGTEPNLANVEVVITTSNGVQQTVNTDGSGNWTASVPPGSTTASVNEADSDFPAGATQTQGTNPYMVTAVANATTFASNNGYYIAALVSGHLYVDTNGNGIQDGTEPDLPNIDITVTDSAGAIQSVTTNAIGDWIALVPPGSTIAKVDTAGSAFTNSVPAGYVQTEGSDTTTVMAVANVDTTAGKDGYFIPAILSGHLYVDSNGNGSQDGTEPNLVNVDVVITDSNGDPQTVSTHSNGNWTASVPPGSTTIKVTTTDLDFVSVVTVTSTQTEGDDPTTVVAVANVTTSGGVDGFQPSALYSIGGQVRFDSDRNGSFLDVDKPLGNFTVKLYADTNGNGLYDPGTDTLLDTKVSGNDGIYKFTGYPNGNYVVVESPPNAALQKTNDKDGNNDRSIPVVVSGAGINGNDFLEFADPQGWFYDTETGAVIPGGNITVSSVPPGGSTNIILDGSNGEYAWLTNGVAGDYVMSVTVPPGYTLDPSRPANPSPLVPNGQPDPVTVGSNVNIAGTDLQDFSAVANTWYLTFTLQSGDPRVLYNNIPLLRTGCPVSFTGWQTRHPLGGVNAATDNPDGDDYTNLEEFAFCMNPSSGVADMCPLDVVVNANGTIDAMVHRVIGAIGITYQLEYISDLSLSTANGGGWTPVQTISPMVMSNGDGTETAMYQNLAQLPALAGGKGFVRVKVTQSASGTVVRTHASGWSTRALSIGAQSCGDPFLFCPVFSGTVDGVAGNVVDVTTAAGGESIVAKFVATKQYFIEVVSGDNAGHRWEIDEANSTASTLAIDLASTLNTKPTLPANLASDRIALRQHITLKEVFPPAKFNATNAASSADRILIKPPGTTNYTLYWLFNNAGNPKWVDTANATLADVGVRILDNNQGVFIHPKFAPATLVMSGQVRQNVFACPIKTGPNMIANGWPMNQSATSLALTVPNGFTGSSNPLRADKVTFWVGDDTPGREAYISHFELNAGGRQYLTGMSNATLTNEDALPLFKALRGGFIQSIAGKSNWVQPLPWTP